MDSTTARPQTRSRWCILPVLALASSNPLSATKAQQFHFYDIGDLGCTGYTEANGLNDTGMIVGVVLAPDCTSDSRAFLWLNGALEDISGSVEGVIPTSAEGISDTIHILGVGGPDHVLSIFNGASVALDPPPGCEENRYPNAINLNGEVIAGSCCVDDTYNIEVPAIYWTADGSGMALPVFDDLPDSEDAYAQDVNDDGLVVGETTDGRGFYWIDGELYQIPNEFGGEFLSVNGVNNKGLVVGSSSAVGAISYDIPTGVTIALGDGTGIDVNDRGTVVGSDIIDFIALHATRYDRGAYLDLQPFLPPDWTDSHALGINNYGWMVGWGWDSVGDTRAWLLVPIYDKGDYDGDEDVDLHDFGHFQECFAAEPYQGPEGRLHVGCSVFDFDDDVDLDLTDYAAFQAAFTGPITSGW